MIVGDAVTGRLVAPATRERLAPTLVAVLGLPLVAFVLDPSLPVAAGLLMLSGTGFSYGLGIQRQFRDVLPASDRGPGFGLMSTGLMTAQGLGPSLFGGAAEVTPIGGSMALAGAATAAAALTLRTARMPSGGSGVAATVSE